MTSLTNRRSFLQSGVCFAAAGSFWPALAGGKAVPAPDYARLQGEIDLVSSKDYAAYLKGGQSTSFAALRRLEAAAEKLLKEVAETKVPDPSSPAVWLLYNMGIIVKTPQSVFAVDLMHRRAAEFAPLLDFALVTHNHADHCSRVLYREMDGSGKSVVSNFLPNNGAKVPGYVDRKKCRTKTFTFKDVTVKTGFTDHNDKLVDYTSFFEIKVGSFTIFHSGDCSNYKKLELSRTPDFWVVHPYCGMDAVKGAVERVKPRCVVIAHLQELSHAKNRWRWTFEDGIKVRKKLSAAGIDSVMPLWGERIK